ncbi:hypothetical protein MtrunA17_Chr7g0235111 [Medicago truncatula]|uniref:Transmembrane protein n=1 Tax=Medicago truncatula TaxID=3880 RepID=A0A396GZY2_MEDTR|nr:hypothetical protein MtrunA17_Chr7g0235111 [Medicago truncatula]
MQEHNSVYLFWFFLHYPLLFRGYFTLSRYQPIKMQYTNVTLNVK